MIDEKQRRGGKRISGRKKKQKKERERISIWDSPNFDSTVGLNVRDLWLKYLTFLG